MAGSTLIITLWVVAALCIAIAVVALVVAGKYGHKHPKGGEQGTSEGTQPATGAKQPKPAKAAKPSKADGSTEEVDAPKTKRSFGFRKPSKKTLSAPSQLNLADVFPTDEDPTAMSPTGATSSLAAAHTPAPGSPAYVTPEQQEHFASDDRDGMQPTGDIRDSATVEPTNVQPAPATPAVSEQASTADRGDPARASAGGWKPRPPKHSKAASGSGSAGQPTKVVAGISAVVSPWTPAAQGRAGGRHRKAAVAAPVTPAHVQALLEENSSLPAPDRAGSAHQMAEAAAAAAAQARIRAAARLGDHGAHPESTTAAPAPVVDTPPAPAAPVIDTPPAPAAPVIDTPPTPAAPAAPVVDTPPTPAAPVVDTPPTPAAPAVKPPEWRAEDIPGAYQLRVEGNFDDNQHGAPQFQEPAAGPHKDSNVSSLSAQHEHRGESSHSDLDMTARAEPAHFDYRAYGLPEDLPLPMSGPTT